MNKKLIILLIIILIFILYNYNKIFNYIIGDHFSNTKPNIDCHVIHMVKSSDRIPNIMEQFKKINYPAHLFNATDGKDLDLQSLIKSGFIDQTYYNRIKNPSVYGCYMSHYKLIEMLLNKYQTHQLNTEYSIIFEDDFNIVSKNFTEDVNNIIKQLENKKYDFDIILLGSEGDHNGEEIIPNVFTYGPTGHAFCLHGYLVNNKNLNKIYNVISYVDEAIDWKVMLSAQKGLLNLLLVKPDLVKQYSYSNDNKRTMKSTING